MQDTNPRMETHHQHPRRESHNLHGDGGHEYEVYDMPKRGQAWWESVTDVPCPVEGCGQTVVWYEAGYVPGYRVCMALAEIAADGHRIYNRDTLRHRFLASDALEPGMSSLIRDECCETSSDEDEEC